MRADAEDEKRINEDAHARVMKVVDRTEQLANEIRPAKVDSGRFMRNKDTGTKVLMHIGAIASGMLSGLQGGPNEFMNRLDGYIEQDIREQQAEIDNKKAALHANQSMVGQLLQVTGDRRVAADVARRLMYESAKTDLAAKSARYGIPEAKVATDLAMNAMDQKITNINAEGAKALYEAKLREAAAAAAARKAAEKEVWERSMKVLEMGQKQDEIEIKRQHELGDQRDPLGKEGRQKLAAEEAKTQQELDANLRAVDSAQKDVDKITAGTVIGKQAAEHLPAFVPGVTTARSNMNTREAYNRRVMIAIGAAYKLGTDATEPKNKELIEHFAAPYEIQPSDNKEIALQKMTALRKLLAESAAAKGAQAPAMPASFTPKGGK
jgi:hypothetical protein